jgi:hypothetical protein
MVCITKFVGLKWPFGSLCFHFNDIYWRWPCECFLETTLWGNLTMNETYTYIYTLTTKHGLLPNPTIYSLMMFDDFPTCRCPAGASISLALQLCPIVSGACAARRDLWKKLGRCRILLLLLLCIQSALVPMHRKNTSLVLRRIFNLSASMSCP